jgi:hypothetical protein
MKDRLENQLSEHEERIIAAKQFAKGLDDLFKEFYSKGVTNGLNPLIVLVDDIEAFQKSGNKCTKDDFIAVNNGLLYVGLQTALEPIISLQG